MTIRVRLTLWFAATFVLCGGALLAVAFVVVSRSADRHDRQVARDVDAGLRRLQRQATLPGAPPLPRPFACPPAAQRRTQPTDARGTPRQPIACPTREEVNIRADAERRARADQRRAVAAQFGGAAGVMTLLSLLTGWIVSGRALRPVAELTAVARRVGERNLGDRVGRIGPRDELGELAGTFDLMLARLEAAFDSRQQFVASASHELRTPLAVIRGELDATLADPAASEPELREMAAQVSAAVARVEHLIESLLTLARSDRPPARRSRVDLGELAEASLDPLAGAIATMDLQVRFDGGGALVEGDALLLERLVFNLLENAVTYNVRGGFVDVTIGQEGGGCSIEVANSCDTTGGDLDELLEPFVRRDASRARAHGGAGLGLAIVRAVARSHGGDVAIERGGPACVAVTVRLPAAPD
jgi:signal transduction histidine kinase